MKDMKKFTVEKLIDILMPFAVDGITHVDRGAGGGGMFYVVFSESDAPDTLYRIDGRWSNNFNTFSLMGPDGKFCGYYMNPMDEIECREVEAYEEVVVNYRYKNE